MLMDFYLMNCTHITDEGTVLQSENIQEISKALKDWSNIIFISVKDSKIIRLF